MKVRDLMTKDPEACVPSDSCAKAGEIMQRRNCGFVPVVEDQKTRRVVGVVTDRDITLHLVQADSPPSQLPVQACMTRQPKAVSPDAEMDEAAEIMQSSAIHRLPVVEEGALVGVLALKDIAGAARAEWSSPGAHRTERQVADIVEAISTAR